MGCTESHNDGFDGGKANSRAWDKKLQREKHESDQIHKLLLLGPGNSGKSTFFKQLTQIHGGGFQDDEFNSAKKHIQDAIVVQMKNLLNTFKNPENDEFKEDFPTELFEIGTKVSNLSPEQPLAVCVDEIAELWSHPIIKQAYNDRSNLGIADSAPRFLDDLNRIKAIDYRPTADDILYVRIPTTGMRDKKFTINGTILNIFDVGGQRSERNKWIHCFDTVHGVLFVASLSCYDQYLYEENELNAMDEALELFNIVVNSRYFMMASMILFLNKEDLFHEKILNPKKPLSMCFSEYKGATVSMDSESNEVDEEVVFNESVAYITMKFKEQISSRRDTKSIYTHVTCATDRDNVKKVFDDVQHAVVTNALRHNGLI